MKLYMILCDEEAIRQMVGHSEFTGKGDVKKIIYIGYL